MRYKNNPFFIFSLLILLIFMFQFISFFSDKSYSFHIFSKSNSNHASSIFDIFSRSSLVTDDKTEHEKIMNKENTVNFYTKPITTSSYLNYIFSPYTNDSTASLSINSTDSSESYNKYFYFSYIIELYRLFQNEVFLSNMGKFIKINNNLYFLNYNKLNNKGSYGNNFELTLIHKQQLPPPSNNYIFNQENQEYNSTNLVQNNTKNDIIKKINLTKSDKFFYSYLNILNYDILRHFYTEPNENIQQLLSDSKSDSNSLLPNSLNNTLSVFTNNDLYFLEFNTLNRDFFNSNKMKYEFYFSKEFNLNYGWISLTNNLSNNKKFNEILFVIYCFNNLYETILTLKHLNTADFFGDIIIIDYGSTDGSVEYLQKKGYAVYSLDNFDNLYDQEYNYMEETEVNDDNIDDMIYYDKNIYKKSKNLDINVKVMKRILNLSYNICNVLGYDYLSLIKPGTFIPKGTISVLKKALNKYSIVTSLIFEEYFNINSKSEMKMEQDIKELNKEIERKIEILEKTKMKNENQNRTDSNRNLVNEDSINNLDIIVVEDPSKKNKRIKNGNKTLNKNSQYLYEEINELKYKLKELKSYKNLMKENKKKIENNLKNFNFLVNNINKYSLKNNLFLKSNNFFNFFDFRKFNFLQKNLINFFSSTPSPLSIESLINFNQNVRTCSSNTEYINNIDDIYSMPFYIINLPKFKSEIFSSIEDNDDSILDLDFEKDFSVYFEDSIIKLRSLLKFHCALVVYYKKQTNLKIKNKFNSSILDVLNQIDNFKEKNYSKIHNNYDPLNQDNIFHLKQNNVTKIINFTKDLKLFSLSNLNDLKDYGLNDLISLTTQKNKAITSNESNEITFEQLMEYNYNIKNLFDRELLMNKNEYGLFYKQKFLTLEQIKRYNKFLPFIDYKMSNGVCIFPTHWTSQCEYLLNYDLIEKTEEYKNHTINSLLPSNLSPYLFSSNRNLLKSLEEVDVNENKKIIIALTISNPEYSPSAGDIFTAKELKEELMKRYDNVEVRYLYRDHSWYSIDHLKDVDILIVMLHDYNLAKTLSLLNSKESPITSTLSNPTIKSNLITIAWSRNWFNFWTSLPWMGNYDLILTSSVTTAGFFNSVNHLFRGFSTLCIHNCPIQKTSLTNTNNENLLANSKWSLFSNRSPVPAEVFYIATGEATYLNNNMYYNSSNSFFTNNTTNVLSKDLEYEKRAYEIFNGVDYIFTGSYFRAYRKIMEFDPDTIPKFKGKIVGDNWQYADVSPGWKNITTGLLPYPLVLKAYKYVKIVIDDANHVTGPWGSVNSRVFDALGAGCLVVSNGFIGIEELFGKELRKNNLKLPIYKTGKDLGEVLKEYLSDENLRLRTMMVMRDIVLKSHTYSKRAEQLGKILYNNFGIKLNERIEPLNKEQLNFLLEDRTYKPSEIYPSICVGVTTDYNDENFIESYIEDYFDNFYHTNLNLKMFFIDKSLNKEYNKKLVSIINRYNKKYQNSLFLTISDKLMDIKNSLYNQANLLTLNKNLTYSISNFIENYYYNNLIESIIIYNKDIEENIDFFNKNKSIYYEEYLLNNKNLIGHSKCDWVMFSNPQNKYNSSLWKNLFYIISNQLSIKNLTGKPQKFYHIINWIENRTQDDDYSDDYFIKNSSTEYFKNSNNPMESFLIKKKYLKLYRRKLLAERKDSSISYSNIFLLNDYESLYKKKENIFHNVLAENILTINL